MGASLKPRWVLVRQFAVPAMILSRPPAEQGDFWRAAIPLPRFLVASGGAAAVSLDRAGTDD
jgi:hypothetical protein